MDMDEYRKALVEAKAEQQFETNRDEQFKAFLDEDLVIQPRGSIVASILYREFVERTCERYGIDLSPRDPRGAQMTFISISMAARAKGIIGQQEFGKRLRFLGLEKHQDRTGRMRYMGIGLTGIGGVHK